MAHILLIIVLAIVAVPAMFLVLGCVGLAQGRQTARLMDRLDESNNVLSQEEK